MLSPGQAQATAKRSKREALKDHATFGGKTALWYGIIQLAVEVVKLIAHH
jgi:hypothetical protein